MLETKKPHMGWEHQMRISQETLSMVPPGGEVPTKPDLSAATPGLGATLGTCSKWGLNQARFCTHNQLSSWKGQPVEMSIRNRMFAHVGWGENSIPGNLATWHHIPSSHGEVDGKVPESGLQGTCSVVGCKEGEEGKKEPLGILPYF